MSDDMLLKYIYGYGSKHKQYGTIEHGDWILTDEGWRHYKYLKELEATEIPF